MTTKIFCYFIMWFDPSREKRTSSENTTLSKLILFVNQSRICLSLLSFWHCERIFFATLLYKSFSSCCITFCNVLRLTGSQILRLTIEAATFFFFRVRFWTAFRTWNDSFLAVSSSFLYFAAFWNSVNATSTDFESFCLNWWWHFVS